MENNNRDNKAANGTDLDGTIASLFRGIEQMSATKAVIGDPVQAGDALILPLVEISAGMAAGDFNKKGAGALNTRITPVALLVIENGQTRLMTIGGDDSASKILDMIPDALSRLTDLKTGPDRTETESGASDSVKILSFSETKEEEGTKTGTDDESTPSAVQQETEKKGISLFGMNHKRTRQ